MSWLDEAEEAEARTDPYGLHAEADTDFRHAQELLAAWYARHEAGAAGRQALSHQEPAPGPEPAADRRLKLPAPVPGGPYPDWQRIRGAEASARQIGMRASIPDPSAAGTPAYQADAAAWGTGQGVAAEPEAG